MTTKVAESPSKEMTTSQKQALTGAEPTHPGRYFTPAVDILETADSIRVLADMPGVRKDGLGIDLRDNVLTINGVVEDVAQSGERTLIREYETGSFYRQFRLSNVIDQNNIEASLQDGVLHLTLHKAQAARPRKIDVRAG